MQYIGGEFLYSTSKGKVRTYGTTCRNVIQALARIVITEQMLDIQSLPEVDIVLQVHDEIIAIGSEVDSDVTMNTILDIMRTPPEWCSDLPFDAEGE